MQEFYVPLLITLRKEYKFEIKTILTELLIRHFIKRKISEGEIINNFDSLNP